MKSVSAPWASPPVGATHASHAGRHVLAATIAVTILIVAYAAFYAMRDAMNGRPVYLVGLAVRSAIEWTPWIVLGPLAWDLAQRVRFDRPTLDRAIAFHIAAAITFALAHAGLNWLLLLAGQALLTDLGVRMLSQSSTVDPRYLALRFDANLLVYAFVIGCAGAAQWADAASRARIEQATADRLLADARLASLQQQLRPHFVLNALNAFVTEAGERPAEAQRIARLLRHLLERLRDDPPTVRTVAQELQFARLYLDIESARFSDRLVVNWQIAPDTLSCPVPSFALQTLVENAIRHGMAKPTDRFVVDIAVVLADGRLRIDVVNDGAIRPAGDSRGNGIGLANLRDRVRIMFGSDAILELVEDRGRTRATLAYAVSGA